MSLVAAIQMTSAADVPSNLATAERLLREAHREGAVLAVLPENFAFMGAHERDKLAVAEPEPPEADTGPPGGPIQALLSGLARELGMWIVGGTIPLKLPGQLPGRLPADSPGAPGRVAAACLVYDGAGRVAARYDKIHLFDVDLPGRNESYRESVTIAPGQRTVVVQTPAGKLGLAVCYDLRFPELFRQLTAQGAQLLSLPAAFTVPTGEAHWEVLLRARAVENLCYVVASAQWGRHASGRDTYGHSMIIEPWGTVLRRREAGAGVVLAQIDLTSQSDLRKRFPALSHRRLNESL